MRNKNVQFPHPLLSEHSRDILDSSFGFTITNFVDEGYAFNLSIETTLACPGLQKLYEVGKVKALVRLECKVTSYRRIFDIDLNGITDIRVEKSRLAETFELEPWVVATEDINTYKLDEFNKNYFGNFSFQIKKGNALATADGININLQSIAEQNMSGIVNVTYDEQLERPRIYCPKNNESDTALSDYITVILPKEQFCLYRELKEGIYQKHRLNSILLTMIVLPAVSKGIAILKKEMQCIGSISESEYRDTVWAESILSALKSKNIDLESCDEDGDESSYDLANMVFSDVVGRALTELASKMEELDNTTMNRRDEL